MTDTVTAEVVTSQTITIVTTQTVTVPRALLANTGDTPDAVDEWRDALDRATTTSEEVTQAWDLNIERVREIETAAQ